MNRPELTVLAKLKDDADAHVTISKRDLNELLGMDSFSFVFGMLLGFALGIVAGFASTHK